MTLNTILCFILTISLLSGVYKRIMIKSLRKSFNSQDDYSSFLEYGIEVAYFKPFRVMKYVRLGRLVEYNIYYKFMSKFYLFQVLFSILGFILIFVFNFVYKIDILRIKF